MKRFYKTLGVTGEEYRQMTGGIKTRRHEERKIESQKRPPSTSANDKYIYEPPQLLLPEKIAIPPKEIFSSQIFTFMKEESYYVDLEILFKIYEQVNAKGGTLETLSIGCFEELATDIYTEESRKEGNTFMQELTKQKMEDYQNILFTFEFLKRNPFCEKKLYKVELVNFVNNQELQKALNDKEVGLKYFNYDLTLFQEGAKAMKFDSQVFNCEHMAEHYGDQKIDIRIQNPCDYGFAPYKLKNRSYSMLLKDYHFYQLNYHNCEKMKEFKHVDQLRKGQIFFGVNFQPDDDMLNTSVKKSCQNKFLDFYADFDLLSYMDQDVPGCSIPQMYFKAPGCWTGGHQENVCMSALNINHGPDHSEWFTLDLKYVEQLRKQLLKQFNMDLYESEGLWYQGIDWFIERNYPVKRFLQKKDDIVVTGPGTLHWVRSFGTALQTSWNMFPKTLEQFQAAYHRQEMNIEIKFKKADIIPLKALTIRYLNHEKHTMSKEIRQLCCSKLKKWFFEQNDILDGIICYDEKIQYLTDNNCFCQSCFQQICLYYLPPKDERKRGVICLKCYKKEEKELKTKKFKEEIDVLFKKHEVKLIKELIIQCEENEVTNSHEISGLCEGNHIGKTPCSKGRRQKKKQKAQQKHNKQPKETVIHFSSFAEKSTDNTREKSEKSQIEELIEMNKKLLLSHEEILQRMSQLSRDVRSIQTTMKSIEKEHLRMKKRREEKAKSQSERERERSRSREKMKQKKRKEGARVQEVHSQR